MLSTQLRVKPFCAQQEKSIFHSRTLQEEIKPCFSQLDPIISSYLCLQYLITITSFKECKCNSFFPFEKVSTTRLTCEQDYTLYLSIWGGELRGTHEHEWIFSPFFWKHQSLRFFDVRSKTVTKNFMWYLSYTSSCCPICCLVLAGAGLALAPLFFLHSTDISSIFPSGRTEQWMTLLGFQLIPTSTHTLNWEKIFI